MKKSLFVLMMGSMMTAAACSNEAANNETTEVGGDTATTQAETPAPAAPSTADADKQKGVELIAQSDCLTCHKVDEKLVGPSYRDVANKYANDDQTKTLLAEKIIKGGSGVWGQVPMTPHPNISQEDAKAMVTYIMSLKQN